MAFIFQFVNVVNYIDLRILKNPWIFLMCLDSDCYNFVEEFASMFISDIGL